MDLTTFLVVVIFIETILIIIALYEYFHLPDTPDKIFKVEDEDDVVQVVIDEPWGTGMMTTPPTSNSSRSISPKLPEVKKKIVPRPFNGPQRNF